MSTHTVSGKKVEQQAAVNPALADIIRESGVDARTAAIAAARTNTKFSNTEQLRKERFPTEAAALPQYYELKGMHEATEAVADALLANKKIAVYGDYDADGNTSSTIISQTIKDYTGETPEHYIPWRTEGYGLSIRGIDALHAKGVQTVVVVDCGTTSIKEVAHAKALGMDVVILDHHQPRAQDPLPDCPLVNPSRPDDAYPHKGLCAAGLSYIFARDLNIRLKQEARYDTAAKTLKGPLLVAAAIGTITDVMPLDNPVNRYLVQAGLKEMNTRNYPGINALMDIYGLKQVRESDIGFLIGPVFNAAGRMGQPDLGLELLMAEDTETANRLAKQLVHANNERKILTQSTADEAFEKAEAYLKKHPRANFLMLDDPRWDKGIVGIVASRLKEHYGLPVALGASYTGADGIDRITYSVRSIPGVDFFHLALSPLIQSGDKGLLGGGGHAMAAGMTVTGEGRDRIAATLENSMAERVIKARKADALKYDAEATLDDFQTPEFVQSLYNTLGPVGTAVPAARFLVRGVQVKRVSHMGPKGKDLDITLGYAHRADVLLENGVAFRTGGTELGKTLQSETRYAEEMDVIVEPYLFENNRGKLSVGYHVVDAFKPRKLTQSFVERIGQRPSRMQQQAEEEAKPKIAEDKVRKPSDIYDPNNKRAQADLKVLYDKKVCLFDTETSGKNAGKVGKKVRTNGITQIAALKVGYDSETNRYYPIVKEWHVTTHKPSYFAYNALKSKVKDLDYKPWKFEFHTDTQAQDVTNMTIVRDTPNSDIKMMRFGDVDVTDAKPFYAVAADVFDFFEGTNPCAYNAAFDMPVMDTHWNLVAQPLKLEDFGSLPSKQPHLFNAIKDQYEERFARPMRERLEGHSELMEMFTNPAKFNCAMYGAIVHIGEGLKNRLPNTVERYDTVFTRDDNQHNAGEDTEPMVGMVADQIRYFGGLRDMRGLWEDELRKIDPDFRVEETQIERVYKVRGEREPRVEIIRGQLKIIFPPSVKTNPKVKAVADFLQSSAEVSSFNKKSRSMILESDMDSPQPSITLLNKKQLSNSITYWRIFLKHFAKWSASTGVQLHGAEPVIYPTLSYHFHDYSARADFVLTEQDGTETVIDGVPLGAFRRSESFIMQPEQRARLADYLKALRFLDRLDFTGIASITTNGIEISGVQREFGNMTIAVPPNANISDFLTQNREQIKSMLKMSGIPMVRGTHVSDEPTNDIDKLIADEEREEVQEEPVKKTAIRLRTKVDFSPNPRVEVELSPALLSLVGRHMQPPQEFTLGEQHLSGIYCEATDDPAVIRMRGNLEAFKEIGEHVRNAAWLMYRFQTLPSVRASQTKLDEKTETLTLYCTPSPRTEDLWILERAHVPCHVFKDRIEIELKPLMHEPHQWYTEVTKELKFVQNNRSLAHKMPEPEALKDVAKALAESRLDAYHTDRNHHAWVAFAGMRNVPMDLNNGALIWRTSKLQSSVQFPETVKDVWQKSPPNIAHLLCDSVGHSQPKQNMFREDPSGRMHIRIPKYQKLGSHFDDLGDIYRKKLGLASISLYINPLLDEMRKLAEDEARDLPNRMPKAEKAARITAFHKQFEGLLDQLVDMHHESYEIWDAFKHTSTTEPAFQQVAILDHLRHELLKQHKAFPESSTILENLRTVEHYYERISLAEFKKHGTAMKLIASVKASEEEGRNGAIPAMEKAFDYLGDKYRKDDMKARKLSERTLEGFEEMNPTQREIAYDHLRTEIRRLARLSTQQRGERSNFNGDMEKKLLDDPQALKADVSVGISECLHLYDTCQAISKKKPMTDEVMNDNYGRMLNAYRDLWQAARLLHRANLAIQTQPNIRALDAKGLAALKKKIMGSDPMTAPTPDFDAMDAYEMNNEYLGMKRSFDNLWKSTKKLHSTLLFSHEITNTGMVLHNPSEKQKLRNAADFIRQVSTTQLANRMEYWRTRGLIENVRQDEDGLSFDPTPLFKENVAKYAQEMLAMPEFTPTNPVENASGYPLILTRQSVLRFLETQHQIEGKQNQGLLPFMQLWQTHGKGPIVLTDTLLQRLFRSPVPLTPEDLFQKDANGKWSEQHYPVREARHRQSQELSDFICSALNHGAIFYRTPQAQNYLTRLRESGELQQAWKDNFAGKKPLKTQSDSDLKAILLASGAPQKKFINTLRTLKLDAYLDMQSASHAILRLNQDHPSMLPVVVYEGSNPRARMKQPQVANGTSAPDAKGYAAAVSSHYLLRQMMEKAGAHGAWVLNEQELADPQSYSHAKIANTAAKAHLLTPGDNQASLQKFDGERMLSLIPESTWHKAFAKRADRLSDIGEQKLQEAHDQFSPLYRMKETLTPTATVRVHGMDIAALVGICLQSPRAVAEKMARLTDDQRTEVMAAMQERAKAMYTDKPEWDLRMAKLNKTLAEPAPEPENDYPDIGKSFREKFAKRTGRGGPKDPSL